MQTKNQLRQIRQGRGIAIQALAAKAGCSPALLVAVEKYDHSPRTETRERVAGALGVTVHDIWLEDDSSKLKVGV